MTKPEISAIAPVLHRKECARCFGVLSRPPRVRHRVSRTSDEDIFFGIVRRGAAAIMLKDVGVDPIPNYTRDIKKGIARWDAYLHVLDI